MPGAHRRLLLIVPLLGIGGVERHHLRMLDVLAAHGWTTTILVTVPAEHGWYNEYAKRAESVTLLYELNPQDAPLRVGELLRETRPDVIMISNSELGYVLAPYLRAQSPVSAIVDLLHNFPTDAEGGYARFSVEYEEQIDLTIAVGGGFLVEWMQKHGRTRDNVEVCYDGVDLELWKPDPELRRRTRAQMHMTDDAALIVFVGRLSEEKRPVLAVQVLKELTNRGVRVSGVIAGDGPQRRDVETAIARANLGAQVTMQGAVHPERVRALLAAADVCLQTSMYEGVSVALMEAMASGACVVGPDVGGHRELVPSGAGLLIPRADDTTEVERYASAIGGLLASPEIRARMATKGRNHIAAIFDAKQNMEKLRGLLESAHTMHATGGARTPERHVIQDAIAQARAYLRFVEPSPISRSVPFRVGHTRRRSERIYRAVRKRARPLYRWARRYVRPLDAINAALKRWLSR